MEENNPNKIVKYFKLTVTTYVNTGETFTTVSPMSFKAGNWKKKEKPKPKPVIKKEVKEMTIGSIETVTL